MFQKAHTHVMQNEHIIQMIHIKKQVIQEAFHILINASDISAFIAYPAPL